MSNDEKRIRIELTPEQQSQLKQVGGQDIVAFEFTAEELEQRVVPATFSDISITKHIGTASP